MSTILKTVVFLGCLSVGLSPATALAAEAVTVRPQPDRETTAVERLDTDIRFFASERLKGRGIGTPGIAEAAEYIADRFVDLGLKTDLIEGGPFQTLTVDTGMVVGDPAKNFVAIRTGAELSPQPSRSGAAGEVIELELGTSFNPLALGASGSVSSDVVFVGYGITAPQANFDEYANVDVQGKIVIVLRKEPRLGQKNHPLGKRSPTPAAYFSTKMLAAVTHGAAGVMIVNDRVSAEILRRELPQVDRSRPSLEKSATRDKASHAIMDVGQAGKGAGGKRVPTVSVSRDVVDRLLRRSIGQSLIDMEAAIDETFEPQSRALSGVTATIRTDLANKDVLARNVIAELPGRGALAEETVIVGAHYDHVGMGGIGSLAPGTVAVHNGADDNASGTAALLEIARQLSLSQEPERRRYVFIAFTGEERGLLGSKHYARNPRFGLEETVAMLNLDMVGRLKGNLLSVYGTGTADTFDALVDHLNRQAGFRLDKDPSGYGPSDHQPFYERSVPVLHFFTGLHNDYHRPSDDFEKINLTGLSRITDTVVDAARMIATTPRRPIYQSTSRGKGIRKQKAAYLGVELRMRADRVTISDVVREGPAAQAGLIAGDVIVRSGTDLVASIRDVLDHLSRRGGGDSLPLEVLRGGKKLDVNVTLGEKQ